MDKGQDNLEKDLQALLNDAEDFQFHDFKNDRHATPKMALVGILQQMIENAKNGRYDNKA